MPNKWVKRNKKDTVFWLSNAEEIIGEFVFSFDKKKRYNLFADYPDKMTAEEVEIFDNENPFWAEFFKNRKQKHPQR